MRPNPSTVTALLGALSCLCVNACSASGAASGLPGDDSGGSVAQSGSGGDSAGSAGASGSSAGIGGSGTSGNAGYSGSGVSGSGGGQAGGGAGQAGAGAAGVSGQGAGGAAGSAGQAGGPAGNGGQGGAGAGGAGAGGAGAGGAGAGGAGAGGAGAGGAGAAGMAGSGGSGGGVGPGPSGLPPPPGSSTVPKPSGQPNGTITILNWAGFKGAVTYSFDDDNQSQITNYNTLNAIGVPYTFFMWTGKQEASNSIWKTALQNGHEIANHTQHHDPTNYCNLADITSATTFIQNNLQTKPWTMAAPNGNTCYKQYANGVFFINRGVSPASPVMPNGNSDPLNLNCYIPATGQQASTFNGNVDNDAVGKGGWVIYVVHGFTGDGSAYQPVDLAQMTAAITHTKGLGNVWIGTMVNVGAYWLGQKAFTGAMKATMGSNTTFTFTLPGQFPTGKYLRATVTGGTLTQKGVALTWDPHGYYEIALDNGPVTLGP